MDAYNRYREWLASEYISLEDKQELILIKDDLNEITDRFYKNLEFGTGGQRGLIGIGTNRINIYTIRNTTQGLADYLYESNQGANDISVAIAYDSRNFSDVFAKEAALVLAGNGIKAYLFKSLRPTPELSFAVRHKKCSAGIVITASHNPKEYNGYKVYNRHGGQITPDHAKVLISLINMVTSWSMIKRLREETAVKNNLFEYIGKEIDEEYINNIIKLIKRKREPDINLELKIVYTPLHGSGLMPIKRCLDELGFKGVNIVESQAGPDGDFTTVRTPNPEERDVFDEGMKLAEETGSELILATDPDCDRIGVAVRNEKSDFRMLSGNQIGALLVDYIMRTSGCITPRHAVIKTIVTSELGAEIARRHGAVVIDTLTGFKYIGAKIREFEQIHSYDFLFGYEESNGYLAGTFVRDKDAVIASALICDMAAYHKKRRKSLYMALQDIYNEFGYYAESLNTYKFNGADGTKRMQRIMEDLRRIDIQTGPFTGVVRKEDYLTGTTYYATGISKKNIMLPKSNVIKLIYKDKSWMAIRPSGTEPKLKIYYSVVGESPADTDERLTYLQDSIREFIFG